MPDDIPDMRSKKVRLRRRQPLNDVSSVSSTSMRKPEGTDVMTLLMSRAPRLLNRRLGSTRSRLSR